MINVCRICGKECGGKTCSGACRAKLSRRDASVKTFQAIAPEAHAESARSGAHAEPKAHAHAQVATLEHYYANPDMYAIRTNPELLNWGPLILLDELAGSKFAVNRVDLPGDFDYKGKFA